MDRSNIKNKEKVKVISFFTKAIKGIFKSYVDDVKSNSSVDPKILSIKFEDVKKQIIEIQKEKKEEFRLAKTDLIEALKLAKNSLKDVLLKGDYSTMDEIFEEEFNFDEDDFSDFEEPIDDGMENEVVIVNHFDENELNNRALNLIFMIASIDNGFATFVKDNEIGVMEIIQSHKVSKDPNMSFEPAPDFSYKQAAMEAYELSLNNNNPEINTPNINPENHNDLNKMLDDIIVEFKNILDNDQAAILAVYALIYKAQAVYCNYLTSINQADMNPVINIYRFVEEKIAKCNPHFIRFVHLTQNLYSTVEATNIALAWYYGLIFLQDKYPELNSKIQGFILASNKTQKEE